MYLSKAILWVALQRGQYTTVYSILFPTVQYVDRHTDPVWKEGRAGILPPGEGEEVD